MYLYNIDKPNTKKSFPLWYKNQTFLLRDTQTDMILGL